MTSGLAVPFKVNIALRRQSCEITITFYSIKAGTVPSIPLFMWSSLMVSGNIFTRRVPDHSAIKNQSLSRNFMNITLPNKDRINHLRQWNNILLLPTSAGTLCLPLDSIIRVEASSNYSKVYCTGQAFPIVVAKVLRWFEERVPQPLFIRFTVRTW
jgi:hypothetical protein